MNKTQRGALINLIGALFNIGIVMLLFTRIVILKSLPGIPDAVLVFVVCGIAGVACILFYRKKQSAVEVESDERDSLIKKRAVMVSFVSTFLFLAIASIVPGFIVGGGGSIPVFLLPIINVCVLVLAMLVYSVAVLVQYYTGSKGEKS